MKTLEVESAYVMEDFTLENRDESFVGNAATWGPMWRGARMLSAVDYMQIERFRRQVMQVMHDLLTEVDLLFLPTYGLFDLVLITNSTGHPGISWRAGLSQSPSGMGDGGVVRNRFRDGRRRRASMPCGFAGSYHPHPRSLGFTPDDPGGEPHTITQNVSLHGRLFEEGKMIAVASAVERKLNVWHLRPPNFSS